MNLSEQEIDRVLGGILRRWITTNIGYYCWDETDLTLDAAIDITPEEFAALSAIGDGEGWWDMAHETTSSGQVNTDVNGE